MNKLVPTIQGNVFSMFLFYVKYLPLSLFEFFQLLRVFSSWKSWSRRFKLIRLFQGDFFFFFVENPLLFVSSTKGVQIGKNFTNW